LAERRSRGALQTWDLLIPWCTRCALHRIRDTRTVAPLVPREFALLMQAAWPIVVDPKSPGGIDSPHGLILFDGVCILCSRGCRFVSKRDRRGYFRFVPIQLAEGRALAAQLGIDPDRPDSFALVAAGQAHVKSEAALRIARELPPWRWLWLFHARGWSATRSTTGSRATAIAGSAVATLACCRARIVRGRRNRRGCGISPSGSPSEKKESDGQVQSAWEDR
jgi:predicted DCC family thiol-disulfide oxidoreductase YuxK